MFYAKKTIALASSLLMLFGCASEGGVFDKDLYDPIDRGADLSREDYKKMGHPDKKEEAEALEVKIEKAPPPIPDVAQILSAPRKPRIGKTKLVSIAVTDDVPLKDVLIELARLADVDIELGQGISGGVSFRAKDKPFDEVIERISSLANLRYKVKDGVLRVERDAPYMKNYSVDFLNVVRNSESDVGISTDVLSSAGGGGGGGSSGSSGSSAGGSGSGGGGGLTSGSTSSITATTESDFWGALQSNLSEIMNYSDVNLRQTGDPLSDPVAAAAEQSAAPTTASAAAGGAASAASERGRNGAFFVINRQAGIISVSASERQHEMVDRYLEMLRRHSSAQVLIEAKIVEVELGDSFQSGVNWSSALGNSNLGINYTPSLTSDSAQFSLDADDNNLGIELDTIVQLTEQFGTSRTLSSPRLHAINNQQAVLTFAENRIYFEVEVEREDDQIVNGVVIPGSTSVTSERRSVPIGIIMSILPSIDMDRNEVTLNVRPTLSRQVDTIQDPGSAIANSILRASDPNAPTFTNEVPIVEVRELDSVMKVKSGGVMIIGGLMEDISDNTDRGVPGVSEIPFFGNAFKRTNKVTSKRELIIFIKASVIGADGNHHPADKRIYEKFGDDPRPLFVE